jgi:hypothetical protein
MALADYGIVSTTVASTSKLSKRKKVEAGTPHLSLEGEFVGNVAKKLLWNISAEGTGDLPADFAAGAVGPAITGITGGVTLIETSEETQTNDGEPNKWTASGVNAPSAT